MMNYGQKQAVMILAGKRMLLPVENGDIATRVLAGESVHPMFFAALEREAIQLHNKISGNPDLVSQANKFCVEIINGHYSEEVEDCHACEGSGRSTYDERRPCSVCDGEGVLCDE